MQINILFLQSYSQLASCVAGAVGAESFNVYLAVPSTNNTVGGRDLALKKDNNEHYEYLMKFDKQENPHPNSRGQTPDTNGQITSDNEEQNSENLDDKDSPDTEKGMEDAHAQELENLKYTLTIGLKVTSICKYLFE